jgi:hypothetical protein
MAREVKVAVVGDARQLQKELQKAERAVAGFGQNAKDSSNMLRDVFIGGTIALGAKQIIDSASQLEAAVGGTAAVFGSASGEIEKFAQSAAKTSGLSEKAARDLTSKLGASLQGAGMDAEAAAKQAVFLTQTGADLAATLGGSTEEAVSALGGALRGEFDPLERFGIALKANDINAKAVSMGLADSETNVSAYAKQQATLALLTEKSAFAQKAFAKESGTAEGAAKIAAAQLQDTSADIGKSFLPIYTKAAEVVGILADAFSKLPSPVQTGVLFLGAAAVVGPKIFQGLSAASTAIKALPGQFEKLSLKMVDTSSAMSGFGTTAEKSAAQTSKASKAIRGLSAATAVISTVVVAYELMSSAIDNARKAQEELSREVEKTVATEGFTALQDQIKATESANMDLYNGLGIWDTLTRWDPWNAFSEAGKMQGLDDSAQRLRILSAAAIALSDSFGLNLDSATVWLGKMAESGVTFGSVSEAVAAYTGSLATNASTAGSAAKAQNDYAEGLKHAQDVLKATTDPIFAVMSAQDSLTAAQAEYEKIKTDGTKTEAEKEVALRKVYSASWDLTNAQSTLGQALATGDVSSAKMQAALDSLRLNGIDPSTEAGQKLIEKMFGTSDTAKVVSELLKQRVLKAETDESNLKSFIEKLNIIKSLREDFFGQADGSPGRGLGVFIPGRAAGGPVIGNNPYMVGENGPELFIPSSAGRIKTNSDTARMAFGGNSGSVMNVTINMAPGANGDDVVDAIRRYERRNGPIFQSA